MRSCPNLNCGAIWTIEEIEEERCAACGYPDNEDDEFDPDEFDDDDDESPEYYQCLGCNWSGSENPNHTCPRCGGASIEGVY